MNFRQQRAVHYSSLRGQAVRVGCDSVLVLDSRVGRPMLKPEHRIAADRSGFPYPSDLTGAEWAVVEPMVPPAKHGGRKRTIGVGEILN
jgi:hypothetical protein